MEIDVFLGRFHPLVVHLPIGFILLAILFEVIAKLTHQQDKYFQVVNISLFAGFLGSLVSVTSGLLLENEGGWHSDALGQHKLFGISVTVITLVLLVVRMKASPAFNKKISVFASVLIVGLVSITGHLGGSLTHGESYLMEYGPSFVRNLIADETSKKHIALPPDSVLVYRDVIQPILIQKCFNCHNDEVTKGGLQLTEYSHLFEGGSGDAIVVAGNLEDSELFRRVTLPTSSKKFMPPKGDVLSYGELNILKWWIEQGADSLARFEYDAMPEQLVGLLMLNYGLDYSPKPYFQKIKVDSIGSDMLQQLAMSKLQVKYLGEENFLLDVSAKNLAISEDQMAMLSSISDKTTFLDLSNSTLPNNLSSFWSGFEHLTRLDLHGTNVSDADIENIPQLKNLEVLNLYGTAITDEGLKKLIEASALKKVYVWRTKVSPDFLAVVQESRPDIEVIAGYN